MNLQEGFARIDQLDFEAFNEGMCMIKQIERYKKLNGHYPEVVLTDQIYHNRENRKFLKDNNIRHTWKTLRQETKGRIKPLSKR